jgi:hypothetical protein
MVFKYASSIITILHETGQPPQGKLVGKTFEVFEKMDERRV